MLAAQCFTGPAQQWWRDFQKPAPPAPAEEGEVQEDGNAQPLPVTNFTQFKAAVMERWNTVGANSTARLQMNDLSRDGGK